MVVILPPLNFRVVLASSLPYAKPILAAAEPQACGSAAASIGFAYGKDDAKTTLKFRGGKITTIKAANMKLIGPAVKLFEGRWES